MKSSLTCPVCDSEGGRLFLHREQVPPTQNLLLRDHAAAVTGERGTLRLVYCPACGFVWNSAFEAQLVRYDHDYENTQTCSPAFQEHVDRLLHDLVNAQGVRGCRIAEVGCGKGAFLRRLVEMDAGNRGIGYDPSYHGALTDLDGRLRFEKRFYGVLATESPADVVVCRHVIEHIPEPVALLRTIRQALAGSPQARVFLETPCVEWILRRQVAWDFFHEHCSYFTAASLTTALEAAGFQVDAVMHVFGGQYLWAEARLAVTPSLSSNPAAIPALAEQFAVAEQARVADWSQAVRSLAAQGPTALWGAGAKGVTFANLVDPERQLFQCVIDVNPSKQGCYLPGSGHRVLGPPAVADLGIHSLVLMNANYRTEIAQTLAEMRSTATLVDLLEPIAS